MTQILTLADAERADREDPLAGLRARFELPAGSGTQDPIYFCGHSLGPMPKRARQLVLQELEEWAALAVRGHFEAKQPWLQYAEAAREPLGRLLGADPRCVVAMNSLTVNLHLMLASFFRPREARRAILIERGAFSSDRIAVLGHLAWHGLDATRDLIEVAPRPGESCVRMDDLEALLEREGPRIALVLWPGIQFRTGQRFDCARLTRAARHAGALVGFDHAHAIGNVRLRLDDDDADFAVWCHYKYVNAGPGAIGGCYVNARHHGDRAHARLAGWWGHEAATRFAMAPEFRPAAGAAGWAVSNPPILSAAPLLASLETFDEVGLGPLCAKSERLTATLAARLRALTQPAIEIITPLDPGERGCQLSVRVPGDAAVSERVLAELEQLGVCADRREPDIIRLAPAPLFNRYAEAWRAAERFALALQRAGAA